MNPTFQKLGTKKSQPTIGTKGHGLSKSGRIWKNDLLDTDYTDVTQTRVKIKEES